MGQAVQINAAADEQELPRKLSLIDAAAIVVGIVIGAGIFLLPNLIAQNLTSIASILTVWVVAGILSYFGALAYAELGAMIPATGGQYVYMREAYGNLTAFVCGWSFTMVVLAGGIGFLAVSFSIYLGQFVQLTPAAAKVISISLIAVLSAVNYIGVKEGAWVQRIFTACKIAGLLLLIGAALFSAHSAASLPAVAPPAALPPFSLAKFGVAMIACLMAYNGWSYVSFVAGEVTNPQRNLPRALTLGMGAVMVLYVLANVAYLKVLSIPELAGTPRVGALLAERTMGSLGAAVLSITVLLSIIGAMNGCVLTAARIPFAQARDGLFFPAFGRIHPRFRTPSFAIILQAVWTAVLVLSGSYQTLFQYSMVAAWIFYTLSVAAIYFLRRKRPDLHRPYKMWGYPYTLCIFILVAVMFLVNAFITRPMPSVAALGIVGTGIPMYWIWRKPR